MAESTTGSNDEKAGSINNPSSLTVAGMDNTAKPGDNATSAGDD